ncbi:DNA-binding protein [Klebsiella phage SopranoGao]|uniref:DNA-binding protein n=1 Tax=Klebsiella phage SopranoGao TaxID=2026944 RepID=A0A248SL11_9CAUD|nr:transcriptional regulator [Klebsiella phage SopranoGao]ASV45070.1 DNA-binding protein [Klebsiella phage SopranoGao]
MKGQDIAVNNPTMTSMEISELVGSRHDNVKRTIETLAESGVITFPQTEEKPTAGRPVTYFVFSGERGKRDSIIVVAQLSPQFTARLVDRWQELESKIAATPPANLSDGVQASLMLVESMKRTLNLSNSSTLGAYRKIESHFALPSLTPAYAIDAPSDAADGSSRTTSALRTILQQRDFPVKVQYAYQRLQELGIVKRMSRPSSRGTEKQFWSITASGLLFGKNMTSPGNPRETQPHFFDSRADELLAMILAEKR